MQKCFHGFLALTCPTCNGGRAVVGGNVGDLGQSSSSTPGDVIDLGNVADRVSDMFRRDARRQGPKPTIQYDPPTE